MSTTAHFPDLAEVEFCFSTLLGKSIRAGTCDPSTIKDAGNGTVGVYLTDDGVLGALCVCDLALSAFAGAAMAMIPAAVAKTAVSSGRLPENILEILSEILNIAVSLFNKEGHPHLALKRILKPSEEWPDDIKNLWNSATSHSNYRLDIPDYGAGRVTLITAPID
jgi:hypothetical protein